MGRRATPYASAKQENYVAMLMGTREVPELLTEQVEAAFSNGLTMGDCSWFVPQLLKCPERKESVWWKPRCLGGPVERISKDEPAEEAPPTDGPEDTVRRYLVVDVGTGEHLGFILDTDDGGTLLPHIDYPLYPRP